jgi:hypothetical protein
VDASDWIMVGFMAIVIVLYVVLSKPRGPYDDD